MKNIYGNQFSTNIHPYSNIYECQYSILENQNETGFVKFYIIDQASRKPIPYATITVYVNSGGDGERDIPIMHLVTTINPVKIELPMASDIGLQILGPEYEFSTYNVSIDVFGYFTHIIYDIRLFPDTTAEFTIEMVPVTQIQLQPIIERRIDIPPHPRDDVMIKKLKGY